MQLDRRQSAAVLTFPQAPRRKATGAAGPRESFDGGRVVNLALMLIVLGLAGLWLAFPPAQLSGGPALSSPIENTAR